MVLPDIIEFYTWVLGHDGHNNPISKATSKALTLHRLMETARSLDDGEHYRRLWVRVKVGVNMFIAERGRAVDSDGIDESMSVWSILSTRPYASSLSSSVSSSVSSSSSSSSSSHQHQPPENPRKDCLFATLPEMLAVYQGFLQSTCPLTEQQRERRERRCSCRDLWVPLQSLIKF